MSLVYPPTAAVRSLHWPLRTSRDPFQGGPLNHPPGPQAAAVQHNVNMVSRAPASLLASIRLIVQRGAKSRRSAR